MIALVKFVLPKNVYRIKNPIGKVILETFVLRLCKSYNEKLGLSRYVSLKFQKSKSVEFIGEK